MREQIDAVPKSDSAREVEAGLHWVLERVCGELNTEGFDDGDMSPPSLTSTPRVESSRKSPTSPSENADFAEGFSRWLSPENEGLAYSCASLSSGSPCWGGADSLEYGADQASRWLVNTAAVQHVPHHFADPAPVAAAPKEPGTARLRGMADSLRVRLFPPEYAGPASGRMTHHVAVTLDQVDCVLRAGDLSLTFADLTVYLVSALSTPAPVGEESERERAKVIAHGYAGGGGTGGSVTLAASANLAALAVAVALPPLRVWLDSEAVKVWVEMAAALASSGGRSGGGAGGGGGGGGEDESSAEFNQGTSARGGATEVSVSLGPMLIVVDNKPSPSNFRYARLQEGHLAEYLHLLPLTAMRLHLLPMARALSLSRPTESTAGLGLGKGAIGWVVAPPCSSNVGGVHVAPSLEFLVDGVIGEWLRDIGESTRVTQVFILFTYTH